MATITPPIAARRRPPILFASVQTRLARPATAIVLIAPATAPPTGASVSDGGRSREYEVDVVRRLRHWCGEPSCASHESRPSCPPSRARFQPVGRTLCARLELQPFHRLAETLTRLLHTKFRTAHRSDEIASGDRSRRRSASRRRVLTRPRPAARGQSESARARSRGRQRLRWRRTRSRATPTADHASFDAAVEISSRARVRVWDARSWTSVEMPLSSSLSGGLRRGSVMMWAPLRFAYPNLHADSTTSPSKSLPRPPHLTLASALAAASTEPAWQTAVPPEGCRSRNALSARAPMRRLPCAFF